MILLQNAASRKAALSGSMIVIDPTSGATDKKGNKSVAGYAVFQGGALVDSGTIEFPEEKIVFERLRNVAAELKHIHDHYDLLVLEEIKGYKAQASLIQACGVYIVGIDSSEFFQLNVSTWKSIAKWWGGYVKSDEQDAIYMGKATVAIALGWKSGLSDTKKEELIERAKEIVRGTQ